MPLLDILFLCSGVGFFLLALPQALLLARPSWSGRARSWLTLPWEHERYPPQHKRRKQTLYVATMLVAGCSTLLRGVLGVVGYEGRAAVWFQAALLLVALGLLIANLRIRPVGR